ncbi:MAG: alpha/beta hydrolase [Actinomycetota bacterium]
MATARTTYVSSTDGVQVAVHDFGGEGPTLLLNHATGFCAHTLQPMIEPLLPSFRCLAVDFRGHGLTGLPPGAGLTWHDLTDDYIAVVRHVAPDGDALAFGHSIGGAVIILAEGKVPGLVRRAWTYEPILLPDLPTLDGDDAPDIAKAAARRRATFGSRREALERYGSRPPLGLLDRRALEAYVDHGFRTDEDGSISLRCLPEHEALLFANHGSGSEEVIGRIDLSITVAAGGATDGPADWVRRAADRHPQLRRRDYPTLSHFGPLQDPDRIAADVAADLMVDDRSGG